MRISRRELLMAAPPALAWAQGGGTDVSATTWYDRPMRWAQVAFTEDDPGQYDAQMWLDYFRRIHADAACLSAGGCVAFYPTKIKYHYRSKYLGDRDSFGELTAGCRKLGMNVIARTDPHACTEETFRLTRNGLPDSPTERRGGIGPIPIYTSLARLDPIISTS